MDEPLPIASGQTISQITTVALQTGLPRWAPFNGILITCGAPKIPEELLGQLVTGGRMVVPIGEKLQEMVVVEKTGETAYTTTGEGFFRFVPMLKGTVE